MQPGLTSANCLTRKPTINLVLEVRDSSFLLAGVASCKAHGSQLHRWVGGAQVVHVRMRTSRCTHLVVSSLCCSWCIMGSSFKCSGWSGRAGTQLRATSFAPCPPARGGKEGTRTKFRQCSVVYDIVGCCPPARGDKEGTRKPGVVYSEMKHTTHMGYPPHSGRGFLRLRYAVVRFIPQARDASTRPTAAV